MFISESKIKVRYAETDQMGVVHHANYPIWFELGRTEFLAQLGMPYSTVESRGVLLPVIELKCTFKGAAKYEDEVVVKTRAIGVTRVKVELYYEVFKNPEGNLITTGTTLHVWTNNQIKPINIEKVWPELYYLLRDAI
jgi:acyl-CoA thioester hydrolase